MVSNSTDIHPTPEGTKPRDQVISSRAHVAKIVDYEVSYCFLFVLLLPFFIHKEQSVSEMALCMTLKSQTSNLREIG